MGLRRDVAGALRRHHDGVGEAGLKSVEHVVHCRVVDGPRINLLTAGDDCDPIAATPHHKNVRVRLRPATAAEAAAAEERSERIRELATAERGG